MVHSLPILGSVNVGNDLIEYIRDSESGFAYVNGDDDALFNAAIELLEKAQLRERMGINSFKLLKEKFSVQQAAKKIILAMEKLN